MVLICFECFRCGGAACAAGSRLIMSKKKPLKKPGQKAIQAPAPSEYIVGPVYDSGLFLAANLAVLMDQTGQLRVVAGPAEAPIDGSEAVTPPDVSPPSAPAPG